MKNKLSNTSRLLLFIAAIGLMIVLFTPIWRIELDAPQYPEGLSLTIHAKGLQGNVDIINGLNHYIGKMVNSKKSSLCNVFMPM